MRPIRFYTGVFLVSFAALMLEIVQTRILSVVVWYHLAFFVISLAMFGLTAGAVWVYLKGERFSEKTLSYDLGYFSGLFAFAVVAALVSIVFSTSAIGGLPEIKPLFHLWLWQRQWIFLLLLLAAVVNPFFEHGLQPVVVKGKFEFPGTHALRKWNSFSRV